jgi:uncharacterized protein (DUF952 family)
MVAEIFHIAKSTDWAAAQLEGTYRVSTLGCSLEEQGFIHCSLVDQVAPVANATYRGIPELILLVIATDRVQADIRYENLEGGDELFPHIYGPLAVAAVVSVLPYAPGRDGLFTRPQDWTTQELQ